MIEVEVLCERYANTYLVSNGKEVIIIDPAVQARSLKQMINKCFASQKVVGIVLTHGHYDHFRNLNETVLAFNVTVYVSKNDYPKINDVISSCANLFGIQKLSEFKGMVKFLPEGKVSIGSFEIMILYTPGHTNGSICLAIEDKMFTGDTLFLNGVGRTDLPTGNSKMLEKSLEKLAKIQDNFDVFPGHGDSIEKHCI